MEKVSYNELTINEKINLRSGFDVAVANERKRNRFMRCINMTNINRNCCQKVYDLSLIHI